MEDDSECEDVETCCNRLGYNMEGLGDAKCRETEGGEVSMSRWRMNTEVQSTGGCETEGARRRVQCVETED